MKESIYFQIEPWKEWQYFQIKKSWELKNTTDEKIVETNLPTNQLFKLITVTNYIQIYIWMLKSKGCIIKYEIFLWVTQY